LAREHGGISLAARPNQGWRPRVAVVGSGISGLAAAHALREHAHVTLFEAGDYFGGHTHTVDVTLAGVTHGVDTGFLVLNERTYPKLLALFSQLDVPVAKSDMSFSVNVPHAFGRSRSLEWSGTDLASVFCQKANLVRPGFWRMLRDLKRFNALATQLAQLAHDAPSSQSLGDFLKAQRFSTEFRDWYLLPMLGCIWSCPTEQMLAFPLITMVRFCHNHGLLQVTGRPQWYTVPDGARQYVRKIVAGVADARLNTPVLGVRRTDAGVVITTPGGQEQFDSVVMATHPGQALALLADPSRAESQVLAGIRYQRNRAVLHTDASVLPRREAAWAAWNFEGAEPGGANRVCLHYLINRLQPLPWKQPVLVSLNPQRPIAAKHIIGEYDYEHPVFDAEALHAQSRLGELQGKRQTWFCGAWAGYGFHEDGLASGTEAARMLLTTGRIDHVAQAVA